MRFIALILVSLSFLPASSQTPLDHDVMNYGLTTPFITQAPIFSSHWHKQWQLSSFSGLYTNYGFLDHRSIGILSAPVGVQLTRRLNTNWFAFARVSAAPAFLSFNSNWRDPAFKTSYPGSMLFNANSFGVQTGVEAGFLYVNDERTFSISGSVHMDRMAYPVYPTYRTGTNMMQPSSHSF